MTTLATSTEYNSNSKLLVNLLFPRRRAIPHIGSTLLYRSVRAIQAQAGDSSPNHRIMGLGGHLQDPSGIFSSHQSRVIQTLALIFATISVLACATTAYWFLMMRRNFRRQSVDSLSSIWIHIYNATGVLTRFRLIGLLICGDFFKSAWYLVFAATALAKHGIATDSKFCQANGFALQAALEACGQLESSVKSEMEINT